VDLDHFKEVNDRFGHRAGDEALRDVAQLLVKHSRSFSIVTRYGGDEFAIILVNTAKGGGVTYADRIRGVIEQHHFTHTPVTVSSASPASRDATNVEDLIVAADQALYDASAPAGTASRCPEADAMVDREKLLAELIEIGLALTSERDLYALLDRILDQARRFTRAEPAPCSCGMVSTCASRSSRTTSSNASSASTRPAPAPGRAPPAERGEPGRARRADGELVNVADAYAVGVQETRAFNQRIDATSDYATRSVLVVPLQDLNGSIVGVLELLNALDEAGAIVPFDREYEKLVRALASRRRWRSATRDSRTSRSRTASPSSTTGATSRCGSRKVKRHTRFGHPLSLVVLTSTTSRSSTRSTAGRPATRF